MAEHVRVLLTEQEVDRRIQEIGDQISRDYAGKQVHLVCVLKGGSFFMCELAKRITVPVSLDFMSVSSYGKSTKSSGVVKIVKDLDEPLKDKDVLVVEDIVDSGRTLTYCLLAGTFNCRMVFFDQWKPLVFKSLELIERTGKERGADESR